MPISLSFESLRAMSTLSTVNLLFYYPLFFMKSSSSRVNNTQQGFWHNATFTVTLCPHICIEQQQKVGIFPKSFPQNPNWNWLHVGPTSAWEIHTCKQHKGWRSAVAVKTVVAPRVNDSWGSGLSKESPDASRGTEAGGGARRAGGVQRQLQTPIPGRWMADVWPRAAEANVKQKTHLLLVSFLNHSYFCPQGCVPVWSDWCCHSNPPQNH